jgi:serine phosphatase RsbU (regulator of sigma subunit)
MSQKKNLASRSVLIILVGYLAILLLLGITTKIGLDNLNAQNESFREVVQQNNVKAKHITDMRDAIRERMLLLNKALFLEDPFEIDETWEEYSQQASNYLKSRELLIQMPLTEKQKQQLSKQPEILGEAQNLLDRVISSVRDGDIDSARLDILEAGKLNSLVTRELYDMSLLQQTIAEKAVESSGEAMQQARVRIISLNLIVLAVASVILLIVIKVIMSQGKKVALLVHELEDANSGLEEKVTERTNELMHSREENLRLGAELAVTHRLQQMLLPHETELSQVMDLQIAAAMTPAEEAGGDYYDVLRYDDRLFIGFGDVTGHGLESSVVMLMAQTAVRTLAVTGELDLVRFVSVLNKVIYDNLQRIDSFKNLTFVLSHYKDGELTICGQHEEVMVVRKGAGVVERIDTMELGFPLGLEENIESFLDTYQIRLDDGDTVMLYTDGIPEAENRQGEFYGLERLADQFISNIDLPVQELHDRVIADLHTHINQHTIYDDITLLVMRRHID